MIRLLKTVSCLSLLLWFGCAQVDKEVKSIREGFVKAYEDTKKAVTPEDSKPKQAAKAAEAPAKPPEPVKPKELPPPPEPAAPKDLPPAPEEFILHKVLTGETLATIAKWYNGKPTAWKEIAPHNPGVQPFNLKAGQRIKVPKSLAIAHQEQPDFSTATGPPASKKSPKESETSGESKPSPPGTVFGPK